MKKKITFMVIPSDTGEVKNFTVPANLIRLTTIFVFLLFGAAGYICLDYWELMSIRKEYLALSQEARFLKSEANVLAQSLDTVKSSLKKVEVYSNKLAEITQIKTEKVQKKTGIGPLTSREYDIQQQLSAKKNVRPSGFPVGLNPESLNFKPLFKSLSDVQLSADNQAIYLQGLLTNLSQRKSFLNSIPSFTPVNGWMASGFGWRTSPFTGDRTLHRGVDLASTIGTPIIAPADGVVLFSGKKDGFGNFIILAHGYGVESRYGHSSQNLVRVGQKVNRGEPIATVGNTGRSTGPHLHYEVWLNNHPVNPQKFMLDQF